MFDNSDYSDIRVLKDFLIMDILNSEHPEDIVNKVKMVFMQSHIPLISKILNREKLDFVRTNLLLFHALYLIIISLFL